MSSQISDGSGNIASNKLAKDSHNTYYKSGNVSAINRGRVPQNATLPAPIPNTNANVITKDASSLYYAEPKRVPAGNLGQPVAEQMEQDITGVVYVYVDTMADVKRAKEEIHSHLRQNAAQVRVAVAESADDTAFRVRQAVRMSVDQLVTQELVTEDRARDVVYGMYTPKSDSEVKGIPAEQTVSEHEELVRDMFLGDTPPDAEVKGESSAAAPDEDEDEAEDEDDEDEDDDFDDLGDLDGEAADDEDAEAMTGKDLSFAIVGGLKMPNEEKSIKEHNADIINALEQTTTGESQPEAATEEKSAAEHNAAVFNAMETADPAAKKEAQDTMNAYVRQTITDYAADRAKDVKELLAEGFEEDEEKE